MGTYSFQQFLIDKINEKADGSQRKFSVLLDVSSSTVSRMLDVDNPTRPELDTLQRIAKVTNTNLITLIRLAYPDEVEAAQSATAQAVAEEFDKLPSELQSAIIAIMRGAKARGT